MFDSIGGGQPFEPESPEEEGYALMAALSGVRAPTGALGCVGLGLSALILLAVGLDGPRDAGIAVGIVLFVLIWSIGPGLLVASAMQSGGGDGAVPAYVRQLRLLTAFWWVAGISGLSFLVLNALTLAAGLLFGR